MTNDEPRRSVDPVLARWLDERGGRRAESELTDLLLVSRRTEDPVPDDVLVGWHRRLAHHRITVLQSEPEFVVQARRAGWPDERIAAVLGLDDGASLPEHVEDLAVRLARAHPSHNARPYTG